MKKHWNNLLTFSFFGDVLDLCFKLKTNLLFSTFTSTIDSSHSPNLIISVKKVTFKNPKAFPFSSSAQHLLFYSMLTQPYWCFPYKWVKSNVLLIVTTPDQLCGEDHEDISKVNAYFSQLEFLKSKNESIFFFIQLLPCLPLSLS